MKYNFIAYADDISSTIKTCEVEELL